MPRVLVLTIICQTINDALLCIEYHRLIMRTWSQEVISVTILHETVKSNFLSFKSYATEALPTWNICHCLVEETLFESFRMHLVLSSIVFLTSLSL